MSDLRATLEASVLFGECQKALRECKTERQLEICARMLDTAAFDDLPAECRVELGAQYAHRLYHITGGLLQ